MIINPIHHRTELAPGRTVTVEWEPRQAWHSQWAVSHNVTGRRAVLGRYATFTEARHRAARAALGWRSARFNEHTRSAT